MHLLLADLLADQTIAELEKRGHRCSVELALTTAELPGRIAGVDGLAAPSGRCPDPEEWNRARTFHHYPWSPGIGR